MAKRNFIPTASQGQPTASSDNKEYHDLGFSSSIVNNRKRYINKDGTFNILRNAGRIKELHVYQWLVLISWTRFFVVTTLAYLVINCLFSWMYILNGIEHLAGAGEDGLSPFWTAFFFSAQTLTTVGYGTVSPVGFGANFIAAFGALVGLMAFALGTGLFFARFSKPNANILFSQNALVAPYQDGVALMFRLANNRENLLTNLRVEVTATWIGLDPQGNEKRMYSSLDLERDNMSMLPLSWTVVHPISETSPIGACTKETCEKMDLEIIIILEGYDDTFANVIRAHNSFKYNEIIWNAKFEPTFYFNEFGDTILELDKLNSHVKLA